MDIFIRHILFGCASFSSSFEDAKKRITNRLCLLHQETKSKTLRMPTGIFLIVDKENGGDDISDELIRRFNLLNEASGNVIDFYYFGWNENLNPDKPKRELKFSFSDFESSRKEIKERGVPNFGGYADLILLDAEIDFSGEHPRFFLHFEEAIRIDLAKAVKNGEIPSLGEFLDALINAAEEFKNEVGNNSGTYYISDKLGILYAKQSLLTSVLDKLGKYIGANTLKHLATRNFGKNLEIEI